MPLTGPHPTALPVIPDGKHAIKRRNESRHGYPETVAFAHRDAPATIIITPPSGFGGGVAPAATAARLWQR